MSLIAKDGNLKLYREVLLASASFPIVFPPVEIDGHLFVDGAARSNVIVAGTGGTERPKPPLYGAGNIYLINNGRLHNPPEALRRATRRRGSHDGQRDDGPVNADGVDAFLFRGHVLGYNFKLVAIPDSIKSERTRSPLTRNRCVRHLMRGARWEEA